MGEVLGGNVVAIWETMREESLGLFEQVPVGRPADLGPLPEELRQVIRWAWCRD